MDDVRSQVFEQSLVVGDGHHAEFRSLPADLGHAVGHHGQGIDVQAGVSLVEDGDLGFQDGHLEDLVSFLLTTGETLIEVALGKRRVHAEPLHPLHDGQAQLEYRQVDALTGRQGLAEKVDHRHPGHLQRVLEGEEHPGLAPDVGGPVGDVLTAKEHRTGGDRVLGAAQQHGSQGGLAGSVGPHEGVEFAGANG